MVNEQESETGIHRTRQIQGTRNTAPLIFDVRFKEIMRIPSKVIRSLFIATDMMCMAMLLCVAIRRQIIHQFGYDSLIWCSVSVFAHSLIFVIPTVLVLYFVGTDRARVLSFQHNNRFNDASTMFLIAFWMMLASGFLFMSWAVSVSKGLD